MDDPDKKSLKLSYENIYLSKLQSLSSVVRYKTNEKTIKHTLNRIRQQQKYNSKAINKFPIRVLLFPCPLIVEKSPSGNLTGTAINLLNLISAHLRSPVALTLGDQREYGGYYLNGTPLRAFRDINEGFIDMSLNLYLQVESGTGITVVQYTQEKFCFVMLLKENQVRKWSIFMPFETAVWISILVISVIFLIVYLLFKEKKWKVLWLLQSSVSAISFPIRRPHHRILWLTWLVYLMVINASYVTSYVTQLIPGKKQHPIKTLKQLTANNITLLSNIGLFREVLSSFPSQNLTPYYESPQGIDINETSALLTSYLTRRYLFQQFGYKFYTVDECLVSRPVGLLVSSQHPNLQHIYRMLERVVDAGLFQHWLNINIYHKPVNATGNFEDLDDRKEYTPLKLKELEAIFMCLAIGLAISIVVLIVETIHFKATLKKRKFRPQIFKVFPYTE